MKTFNKLLTISAIAFLFMLMAPHKSMAQNDGYISDQEFYDNLQDYGTWVHDDQFGDVWVPDVDGDFRPYATNGYWVQTDYGTTWVSYYPWGWATFHYGRWRYDDYYGWEWIPGHQWAPAWVSWRQGGGYYSWAPMQPGISINISFGGGYQVPDNYWVCAPQAYITSRYINRYYAPPARVNYIIHNTTYIHNTYVYNNNTYIVGPRPRDIERVTHRPVTVYRVNNADRPGAARFGGRSINIYRPAIKPTADARPVRVVDAHAYRQQHPNDGIGRVGSNVNMHTNAAKLAAVARTNKPDGRIVRVNPVPAKGAEPVNNKANNPPVQPTHPGLPGGHKNIGPVTPNATQAPVTADRPRHKVVPAVMPPADHHDPTVRQPVNTQQAVQQKEQAQQAEQQKVQGHLQQQQAAQQAKQQAQQAVQQQKAQEQQQQANQQKQAAQQQKVQERQQQQQAAQQARQQAQQQAKQQQQQQAQQAAQQQKLQQKQQQEQAAQQARQQAQQQAQQQAKQQQQQAQQAARQQQQQAQQQQQQAKQQAQQAAQQQKMQQQQQARQQQQAARDAAKKQQEQQQKQQTPPGN